MAHHATYVTEETFIHKQTEENGDIIDMRIFKVDISKLNPQGISYSLVYIRDGKRLIGYDNFEGHAFEKGSHHRHIKERIEPYEFVDEWKLLEDFNKDVEKIKRGTIE